jgi:catechol 2,3-dioxygenase-like lactoylglutathione lyase family enzyme
MTAEKLLFRGLAHICIYTADIESSIRFYQDNLNFRVDYRTIQNPDFVPDGFYPLKYALLHQENCIVELLEPSSTAGIGKETSGAIDHFALEVKNIDDVYETLKSRGVRFEEEVGTFETLFGGYRAYKGFKSVFALGPSGERIELFEYI